MTHAAPRPFQAARSRRPKTPTVLRLESLEDRTLLSAATPIAIALAAGPYDPSQVLVQFRTTTRPLSTFPGPPLASRSVLFPAYMK